MIKVGDRVEFNCLKDVVFPGMGLGVEYVVGTVIEVYPKHRWFSVEYYLGKYRTRMRTSFHFTDIGKRLVVCSRSGRYPWGLNYDPITYKE